MNRALIAGLLIALASGFVARSALNGQPQAQIVYVNSFSNIRNSVFKIETGIHTEGEEDGPQMLVSGSGTAFLIDRGEHGIGLMTAWHVVDGSPLNVTVFGPTESIVCDFQQIGVSDIAWCSLPDYPKSWCPLSVKGPHYGGDVCAWGFPNQSGLSMSSGIIRFRQTELLTDNFKSDSSYVALTCTVDHGFSGGPAIGKDGSVIGVIVIRSSLRDIQSFIVLIPYD